MSLIKCPECEKEISDKAEICPHCGYPIKGWEPEPEEEPADERQDENAEEDDQDQGDIRCGIAALILSVVGMVLALAINEGILLFLPLIIFIISILLSRKCYKWFSTVGFAVSALGSILIGFEPIKKVIFLFL